MFRNGCGVLAFLMAPGTVPSDCFALPWSPEDVFGRLQTPAGRADLSGAVGRTVGLVDWKAFEAQVEAADRCGVELLAWCDRAYPAGLADIDQPPPLLFVRGGTEYLAARGVAVVGTRKPSPGGVALARRLGRDLAAAGVSVVSGLARGIDTAVHLGSLPGPGCGVAVLGTGLDVPYPAENAGLAADLCANGCLISEQWMGTPPSRHVFPRRNRLISALSHAVVVVEGSNRSGALITAHWALEQGRDVGAVPGFPGDFRSRGPNRLLRQGAFVVESVADVFEAVPALRPRGPADTRGGKEVSGAWRPLHAPAGEPGREVRVVADCLTSHPASPDELALATGLDAPGVQRALAWLEVEGFAARDEAHRFVRNTGCDGESKETTSPV